MDETLVEDVLDGERPRDRNEPIRDLIEVEAASTYIGLLVEVVFYTGVGFVAALQLLYSEYGIYPASAYPSSLLSQSLQLGIWVLMIAVLYKSNYARRWHKLLYGVSYGVFGAVLIILVFPEQSVGPVPAPIARAVILFATFFCVRQAVGLLYSHYRNGPPPVPSSILY